MPDDRFDFDLLELVIRPEILDRFRLQGLSIQGAEVTQAIQYYRASQHLTDAADRAPNNSVTLIAGKPAWVRVYVRSGYLTQITGVTGEITLQKRSGGIFYSTIATLTPQAPGTVTARNSPTYSVERGTLTDTLNFIIPADLMCGHLKLVINVNAPGGHEDDFSLFLDVTLRQTLRLAGIMIGYNGPSSSAPGAPNLTLAAPTIANLQTTSAWTLLTFPVRSAATYRSAGTITWNVPLTDPPSCSGCCTPNWVALNNAVQAQRVADGNRTDVLYYGLMAVGIPMGPIIGCNTGTVSTGGNGNGVTMAHELGHACGLPHAPCGTGGDPNYPAYEPYDPAGTPAASIGEYGLDISNGTIMAPNTFKDMMAYCAPRWISLYNYGRLTNNTNLAPVRTCQDSPWWRDIVMYDPQLIPELWLPDPPPDQFWWRERLVMVQPVISIIGVLRSENELEITSVMRLEAETQIPNGKRSDLVAELVGKEGRVVASSSLYSLRAHFDCGCGCNEEEEKGSRYPAMVQAFVSNVEPGAELRIRSGERQLWSRKAPQTEPRIGGFKVTVEKDPNRKGEKGSERLLLEWAVKSDGAQEPEIWVQWSADGKTWFALTTGLRGERAIVDASSLPPGKVQLRLLAGNGFHSAESKRVAVEMTRRAPSVAILSPRDGQTLVAGSPMRLWGSANDGMGEPLANARVRWLVDDKAAGEGLDLFITAPPAGTHTLTLEVGSGAEGARVSSRFITVDLRRGGNEGTKGDDDGRKKKKR